MSAIHLSRVTERRTVRFRGAVRVRRLAATILCAIVATAVGALTASPAQADVRAPAATPVDARVSATLDALVAVPPGQVADYVAGHSAEFERVLTDASAVHAVTGWWHALDGQHRRALQRSAPGFVGNLNGVPFAVRDSVNRATLRRAIAAADSAPTESARDSSNTDRRDALLSVERALTSRDGEQRQLILFEPDGEMRAAVSIGRVDTADDVNVLVPGMLYTVKDQFDDWTSTANDLYRAEQSWLQRFGRDGSEAAVVAWLGYQTPDLTNVLSPRLAERGADGLEGLLGALRAVRHGDQPFIAVTAHSYGSTAALLAVQRDTVRVDALALIGTPGSDARSASALDVPPGGLFVGSAFLDPVAGSGFFGANPGAAGYGATVMSLGGTIDPLSGAILWPTIGHNGYFADGSTSLRNLALIGIGEGRFVTKSRS
jgi:hypothetical protein